MRTQNQFYTDRSHLRRTKTLSSGFTLDKKHEGGKNKVRQRIKTLINLSDDNLGFQTLTQRVNNLVGNPEEKYCKRFDSYDEESQFLTAEFVTEWAKMNATKKQTYQKLRNQFVRKYPTYRQKYKKEELENQQKDFKIEETIKSESVSKSLSQNRNLLKKVVHKNSDKTAIFYSRSKRKCMQNRCDERQENDEDKVVPMPKMSFMTYMKKFEERKKFKIHRIKGSELIENKEKILTLQKEGTKSYYSIKKCLQDAIQRSIRCK